jgi:hypothetical protein
VFRRAGSKLFPSIEEKITFEHKETGYRFEYLAGWTLEETRTDLNYLVTIKSSDYLLNEETNIIDKGARIVVITENSLAKDIFELVPENTPERARAEETTVSDKVALRTHYTGEGIDTMTTEFIDEVGGVHYRILLEPGSVDSENPFWKSYMDLMSSFVLAKEVPTENTPETTE